jgi:hypothetical protein
MSDFKMIPDEDELASSQRDLRFYPAEPANAKTLAAADVARFNTAGYIRPITIFNDKEIADIRAYFDALLEMVIAEGGDSYSISTAHLKYGRVYDLLTNPKIVAHVKDILGDDVVGWGSHFFCKMPGDGKAVAWHQDASYWPLTPTRAVTVWLAIDDADVENACMRFVSGSHHHGHLTYRPSGSHEDNVLNQTVENPEQYGEPIDDILKAGQMSIHSDLLLHGSEANDSNRRRCGLTLRYAHASVKAGLGWDAKGVVVAGRDIAGNWADAKRPAKD